MYTPGAVEHIIKHVLHDLGVYRGVLVFENFPSIRAKSLDRHANSAQACNTVYLNLHGWIVFTWLNETSTFW